MMKYFGFLLFCLLQFSCNSQSDYKKINGVSFVASNQKVTQEHVAHLINVNANYAAVMPFGFLRNLEHPEVIFDSDRQWFGETTKGAEHYIKMLQKNGIGVMLKPQLWVWRGEFTGDIRMKSEEDWKTLEETYTKFALTYAKIAQEHKVAIYCIGTELEEFIVNRPEYWFRLIGEIRNIYKGKLTYAANWDEYTRTPFWHSLDYIGVDAYFPLSDARSPSVGQLKEGWQKWKLALKEFSEDEERSILFTEFGYRSMDYSGKKPWLVDENEAQVNLKAQSDALQVVFDEFWKEHWFSGGFLWKWFIDHQNVGGEKNNRFTPQNKPAEEVIRKHFASKNH